MKASHRSCSQLVKAGGGLVCCRSSEPSFLPFVGGTRSTPLRACFSPLPTLASGAATELRSLGRLNIQFAQSWMCIVEIFLRNDLFRSSETIEAAFRARGAGELCGDVGLSVPRVTLQIFASAARASFGSSAAKTLTIPRWIWVLKLNQDME